MATISVGSGGSGRKAVDADVPLIPIIDLLLCCLMFLLVTAVWNQLAGQSATQQVPGMASVDQPPVERLRLVLEVRTEGYVLSSTAGDRLPIPKVDGAYDHSALRERLAAYHAADPGRRDLTLVADDGVQYENIVAAMDAAVGAGFSALAFSDS